MKKVGMVLANVLTALGVGAVVGLDVFNVGSDIAEDKRLRNMRTEAKVKIPGKLFKRKVIVDGYGNIVDYNPKSKKGGQ